jgi:molybdenum cofactor cytidylyltransferase
VDGQSIDFRRVAVGVLLAAGAGTRFQEPELRSEQGIHKLLATFRGRPLFEWALDAVRHAGLEPWIVWGALGEQAPQLDSDVTVLYNPRWAEGMATSLHVAISHARRAGRTAITVGLADQPLIPASAWAAVSATTTAPIAVATYAGVRRNPVRLDASVWDLLPLVGDSGARELIQMRPELVCEVACQGNPADIDTREDLQQWNSSMNSSSTSPSTKPGPS